MLIIEMENKNNNWFSVINVPANDPKYAPIAPRMAKITAVFHRT